MALRHYRLLSNLPSFPFLLTDQSSSSSSPPSTISAQAGQIRLEEAVTGATQDAFLEGSLQYTAHCIMSCH